MPASKAVADRQRDERVVFEGAQVVADYRLLALNVALDSRVGHDVVAGIGARNARAAGQVEPDLRGPRESHARLDIDAEMFAIAWYQIPEPDQKRRRNLGKRKLRCARHRVRRIAFVTHSVQREGISTGDRG